MKNIIEKEIRTELEAKKHFDLHGFSEIEDYLGKPSDQGFLDFIRWRNLWDFPIRSIENQWFAFKAEIVIWAKERGFKSHLCRDLDFAKLERERLEKLREIGEIPKFGFQIRDMGLIADFCGRDVSIVMDWIRHSTYPPPIHRLTDGLGWQTDADELQEWLEKQGFQPFRSPGMGININRFVKAERARNEK